MSEFDDIFRGAPLMAILRGMGVERSVRLATTAWDLGIDAVEVPLQTEEDDRALRELVRLGSERGKTVGAGTIIDPAQVDAARAAGARYLVSPGLDPRIVAAARDAGLPILPGVATPSEVQLAVSLGLDWLKAFPAPWLGAAWFRHIRGPFPGVSFVATGGLDASNVAEYLDAGVRVAAVGSALEDAAQLERLAEVLRGRRLAGRLRPAAQLARLSAGASAGLTGGRCPRDAPSSPSRRRPPATPRAAARGPCPRTAPVPRRGWRPPCRAPRPERERGLGFRA